MLRLFSVVALALITVAIPVRAAGINILAFGDSLTAGFGLPPDDAFPVKLEAALKAKGHDARVINAGVSGDTSTAGRDRLDWVLTGDVTAVIVALGANHALRCIAPKGTEKAASEILARLKTRYLSVLLAGRQVSGRIGPCYFVPFK